MGSLSVGKITFLLGIAIVSAFVSVPHVALVLLILGLVVAFLNVSAAESTGFLVADSLITVGQLCCWDTGNRRQGAASTQPHNRVYGASHVGPCTEEFIISCRRLIL